MKRPQVQHDFEQRQAEAIKELRHARQFVLVTSPQDADKDMAMLTFTVFCGSLFMDAAAIGLLENR